MSDKTVHVPINVQLTGGSADQAAPAAVGVWAFDANGQFLASTTTKAGSAGLELPAHAVGQTVRLLFGAESPGTATAPTVQSLAQAGAIEQKLQLPQDLKLSAFNFGAQQWGRWRLCSCRVNGKVVKRVTNPDGTVSYLPLAAPYRVRVYEFADFDDLIYRLPVPILKNLQQEIVRPRPIVPPILIKPPTPIPHPLEPLHVVAAPAVLASTPLSVVPHAPAPAPVVAAPQATAVLHQIAASTNETELRHLVVANKQLWIPYLCYFEFLFPFLPYQLVLLATAEVQPAAGTAAPDGNFSATFRWPCLGDRPDLYFAVDQWNGTTWIPVYHPPVQCNIHWDFVCGASVTLVVTDPNANAVSPSPVVNATGTWVMPWMVGGTRIGGQQASTSGAPDGWVNSDGFTNYGGIKRAPFGGTLGFRMGYSNDITGNPAIKYYRFSYQKVGETDWHPMNMAVVRHYVHTEPGATPADPPHISFPIYTLGPKTVTPPGAGATPVANLFEFRPAHPTADLVKDQWPVEDFFGDIYAAFLDTTAVPGLGPLDKAGQYRIQIELFNSNAARLYCTNPPVGAPPPGTVAHAPTPFRFLAPGTVSGTTEIPRDQTWGEYNDGAFVFSLAIDNNPCNAVIDGPTTGAPGATGATGVVNACGFLPYHTEADNVTIAFHGTHPNNLATLHFYIVKAAATVAATEASIDLDTHVTTTTPVYSRILPGGDFSHPFAASVLLNANGSSCTRAAFAESLYVSAKATNGWGSRLSYLDASALRAFALSDD